ncbi:hypothetical protein, partial [Bacillus altitudinis]|uniref:hypothetical protein n=1 Tax=Bacillus altitudinis TaxID=293387 RepID=UPI001CFD6DDB
YFGSQRSVFKLEGVFYLSHLMGSVPFVAEEFFYGQKVVLSLKKEKRRGVLMMTALYFTY